MSDEKFAEFSFFFTDRMFCITTKRRRLRHCLTKTIFSDKLITTFYTVTALTKDLYIWNRQNRERTHRLKGPPGTSEVYPALEAAAFSPSLSAAGTGRYPDRGLPA